jgi:hypothetical protein
VLVLLPIHATPGRAEGMVTAALVPYKDDPLRVPRNPAGHWQTSSIIVPPMLSTDIVGHVAGVGATITPNGVWHTDKDAKAWLQEFPQHMAAVVRIVNT